MAIFDLYIFLFGIILFYSIVVVIRIAKVLYRERCPKCKGSLTRVHREIGDRFIIAITLGILPFKRYKCTHCGWGGIRWSDRRTKKKSKEKML